MLGKRSGSCRLMRGMYYVVLSVTGERRYGDLVYKVNAANSTAREGGERVRVRNWKIRGKE